MTEQPSPQLAPAVLETSELVLNTGFKVPNIRLRPGLNLIHASREASATVLALTLSGRMKPQSGSLKFYGQPAVPADLFRQVALAGVREIDGLERLVSVHTVVREQLAWSSPWYRPTPRNVDNEQRVVRAFDLLQLDFEGVPLKQQRVGDLHVLKRLKLRISLALISREQARLLVVDDIDQLRSHALRDRLLSVLQELSAVLPVVAVSANGSNLVDKEIRIAGSN